MIQFLKLNNEAEGSSELNIISGKNASRFFLKGSGLLFLFIYCTMFLAVAVPFVKTPFMPIYFLGALATTVYVMRFANNILKYGKFKGGNIKISGKGLKIEAFGLSADIRADSITFFEHNILGNLVIRQKEGTVSIPFGLLKTDDREKLFSYLHDISPKKTATLKKIWEFIDSVTVALVLAVHIIQFVVQAYFIPTGSMRDTLIEGDHLFVEKITYGPIIPQMIFMKKPLHLDFIGIRKIQRGDIVIFRPPHEIDKDYIKRCIAVPGDRFEIKEGHVFINGKMQEEPYVKGITTYDNFSSRMKSELEGTVPAGKVIVMGDNRENSQDSRFFGMLDVERIKGKAFILYWNTEQLKKLDFSRIGLIK